MTLPASLPLSMSQISTELDIALPLSLNNPWVLQLAGASSLPVSFSQLLGKTGRFDGGLKFVFSGSPVNIWSVTLNAPFFSGTFVDIETSPQASGVPTAPVNMNFTHGILGPGLSLSMINNTTGASAVFNPVSPSFSTFKASSIPANFITGNTDSFTIVPLA